MNLHLLSGKHEQILEHVLWSIFANIFHHPRAPRLSLINFLICLDEAPDGKGGKEDPELSGATSFFFLIKESEGKKGEGS
jgi:hypothetical protein